MCCNYIDFSSIRAVSHELIDFSYVTSSLITFTIRASVTGCEEGKVFPIFNNLRRFYLYKHNQGYGKDSFLGQPFELLKLPMRLQFNNTRFVHIK